MAARCEAMRSQRERIHPGRFMGRGYASEESSRDFKIKQEALNRHRQERGPPSPQVLNWWYARTRLSALRAGSWMALANFLNGPGGVFLDQRLGIVTGLLQCGQGGAVANVA